MPLSEQSIQLFDPQALEYARAVSEAQLQDATFDVAYAATLVLPVLSYARNVINVAALTGNTTVPAPVGSRKGMKLTFNFLQDATGGRTITWNAAFSAAANGAGTASQLASTTFVFNGTRWVQEAGALTFKA